MAVAANYKLFIKNNLNFRKMYLEMIKQEDFIKLNKTEKVSNLFGAGKELLSRLEDDYTISLYTLYGFFVEVWYKNPDKKIEKIEVCDLDWVATYYENEIELANLF